MTLTGYDAAYPPALRPITDVVAFYIGGDTPHVWTAAEIEAQTARYRLPIWVRSNPYGTIYDADANNCVTALKTLGAPRSTYVALDLETAVDVDYVNVFVDVLHRNSYLVMVYGSPSTVFQNPRADGYWVAGQASDALIIPPSVGIQFEAQGGGGAWDNDLFLSTLALWDTGKLPSPTSGDDVPLSTDVVDTFALPGTDGAMYFDLHADGGLFAYGGAVPSELEYVASANDGSRYHFGPATTPGVLSYPGLPASEREGNRYFVAMSVLTYAGHPVGVGPAGPTGPEGPSGPAGVQGPPGASSDLSAVEARLVAAGKALEGS